METIHVKLFSMFDSPLAKSYTTLQAIQLTKGAYARMTAASSQSMAPWFHASGNSRTTKRTHTQPDFALPVSQVVGYGIWTLEPVGTQALILMQESLKVVCHCGGHRGDGTRVSPRILFKGARGEQKTFANEEVGV